jgi:hypothetical protein
MISQRPRAARPRLLLNRAMKNSACCALLAACMFAPQASAAPVEYVKICDTYGAGYFYVPGTDSCGYSGGASYKQTTAYGTITNTPGVNSAAYGLHSFSYGDQSLAVGNNAWAGGDPTSASPGPLGGIEAINGMAPGSAFFNAGTTAMGENAQAGAGADGQINSTAVGESALANAKGASAFGQASNASGDFSTAYGVSSTSSGSYSVANGVMATASGTGATAIGGKSNASGDYSIAMGHSAAATQTGSIAVGHNASSTGANAIAIGTNASATGSVAVGNNSAASNGGAALGDFASARGNKSAAFGYGAVASGANSVAFGNGAVATGNNSVAVGAGSVASGANTFSVGSPSQLRRITNIAPGTGPNDAVNMVQYNGGLASTLKQANAYSDNGFAQAVSEANKYTDQQVFGGNASLSNLKRDAFSGIAAAVAMGSGDMPSAAGKTRFSMHTSLFENYTGVGASVAHRFDTEIPLSVDAGFAHAADENVGRVGFSVEF